MDAIEQAIACAFSFEAVAMIQEHHGMTGCYAGHRALPTQSAWKPATEAERRAILQTWLDAELAAKAKFDEAARPWSPMGGDKYAHQND